MTGTNFWPEQQQCAAVVTVNFDAESVEQRVLPNQPLWGRFAFGRYGAQVGVYRILDALAKYGTRATFFIPAWDAERYPVAMSEIVNAGHEVAGRGYAYEDFSQLSEDEQRDVLARSEDVFQQVFGEKPRGWRAPDGLMTKTTRDILAERGYLYDSSYCDDDVPYVATTNNGESIVEVPHFPQASDRPYYVVRRSPEVVASALSQELSATYQAGGLLNVAIHPRADYGSGRGVRIGAVESILQSIHEYPRVWTATCAELAEWASDNQAVRRTG